jgi:hypothetical protein
VQPEVAGLQGAPFMLSAPRIQLTRSVSSAPLATLKAACAVGPEIVVLSKLVPSAPAAHPATGHVYMRRLTCAAE